MSEPTHAGGVIYRRTTRREYLIVTSSSGVGWVLPKGVIDPGETPEEAAVREVEEEAAVACEIEAPLGDLEIAKGAHVALTRFFVMRVIDQVTPTEARELRWCDLETAKQLVNSDGAREALDRAESWLRSRG